MVTSCTDYPRVMQDSTSATVMHVKTSENKLILCAGIFINGWADSLLHILPLCRLFEADSMNYGTGNVVLEHASKAQRGDRCMFPPVLYLSTRQRSVVSLTPHPLYLSERAPGIYCIGARKVLSSSLDVLEKKIEIYCPCQELNPRSSSP